MMQPIDATLEDLQRRISALEAELARARGDAPPMLPRVPGRTSWLALGLAALAGWGLTTSTPGTASDSAVRVGPGGVTQVSAPFEVVGAGGQVLMRVADRPTAGAVLSLTTDETGAGRLALSNGKPNGAGVGLWGKGGVAVYDEKGDIAVSVLAEQGKGRVVIWNSSSGLKPVAELTSGHDGSGALRVSNTAGQLVAGAFGVRGPGGGVRVYSNPSTVVGAMVINEDGTGGLTVGDGKPTGAATRLFGKGGIAIYRTNSEIAATMIEDKGIARLRVYGDTNKPVVEIASTANGGEVSTHSAQGDKVASMLSAEGGKGNIMIQSKQQAIAGLGESPDGTAVLYIKNQSQKVVASMGVDTDRGGAVVAANASGSVVSQMDATDTGHGRFAVYNPGSQKPIAVLTRAVESNGGILQITNDKFPVVSVGSGSTGAGYMQLSNQSGLPAIEAALAPSGVGVVRVGPRFKCQGKLMSAAIPDCIIGVQ